MQFKSVLTLSALAVAAQASYNTTIVNTATDLSTETDTITSCGPTVTNCPANNASNGTASISYEAAAIKNSVGLAGVALVGAAILGL